jgi:hypothetical protein
MLHCRLQMPTDLRLSCSWKSFNQARGWAVRPPIVNEPSQQSAMLLAM